MLTHHRKPVCLSIISTDLPVWSVVETAGTLYQKDTDRFHLLLTAPPLISCEVGSFINPEENLPKTINNPDLPSSPRILWLEISPYRVIMTMQGNSQVSYRHFWEQGVYGVSRYWLPADSLQPHKPLRLRNFTRNLHLSGKTLPEHLRLEYELWSEKVQLGSYILNLEIHH
ncbi:hypothetical protein H6G54_22650 [Anabaena cylindrica FACHB-243]|uniref:Uncharacterized protein n=1 Tax=Anabaena cylindrica (strain ATCC 27899 / PCC 7122) TaxID=272123 RepID=K9ZQU2_ANACC|nr:MULTISPECIES: hypothetical protein [Anabaena]AFZ60927.1 hypothetical protein Anacy_5619 [Anabaena cylindrica PCC 7122]MBD2420453.1 hypothetical protein [Anabaena cylindrica FACHB-243]MBY5282381.1 hypothetical protein [Anabaena sp. CCAP 1446/1C]MBY5306307.1 hypothetical protein [Anabaena sp. CCAP 1446/1C]MCM2406921.1 hypothetical protein [Anabaena sp. CCAP 1446/1C]